MPTNPTRTASAESAALMGTLADVRPRRLHRMLGVERS